MPAGNIHVFCAFLGEVEHPTDQKQVMSIDQIWFKTVSISDVNTSIQNTLHVYKYASIYCVGDTLETLQTADTVRNRH